MRAGQNMRASINRCATLLVLLWELRDSGRLKCNSDRRSRPRRGSGEWPGASSLPDRSRAGEAAVAERDSVNRSLRQVFTPQLNCGAFCCFWPRRYVGAGDSPVGFCGGRGG